MRPGVKFGKLLQEIASPVKKYIRKLDTVWEKPHKPTQPRSPVKGAADLKEKINKQDGKRKIKK